MGSIAEVDSSEYYGKKWNRESKPIKSKLTAEEYQVLDKEMNAILETLVKNKPKNRGTQTSELEDLSSSIDMWKETSERVKKSLDDLSKRFFKDETEPKKLASKIYEDDISGSISSQIKERFTTLNLKLTKEVPEDFKIYVDCQHFKPEELKVSFKDGCITVHGKHDVKLDEHGLIKREFSRRWSIPEDVKFEKFTCLFDRHGILTLKAPRKPTAITVPIQIEGDKVE